MDAGRLVAALEPPRVNKCLATCFCMIALFGCQDSGRRACPSVGRWGLWDTGAVFIYLFAELLSGGGGCEQSPAAFPSLLCVSPLVLCDTCTGSGVAKSAVAEQEKAYGAGLQTTAMQSGARAPPDPGSSESTT